MDKNEDIQNIINLIRENGYTLASFAEKMGTTKQNLNGKLKSPSYPTLVEIATTLKIPMWRLFASPDDVCIKNTTNIITCPHCGKQIPVVIEIKE